MDFRNFKIASNTSNIKVLKDTHHSYSKINYGDVIDIYLKKFTMANKDARINQIHVVTVIHQLIYQKCQNKDLK